MDFGDASERGYGSVVYICAKDKVGNRISNLVMAKSWAAPVKLVSLPRLEVPAAYITAKLLDYVIQALPIVVETVYGWSDSQITLAWIRRPSAPWKAFVAVQSSRYSPTSSTKPMGILSRKSKSSRPCHKGNSFI